MHVYFFILFYFFKLRQILQNIIAVSYDFLPRLQDVYCSYNMKLELSIFCFNNYNKREINKNKIAKHWFLRIYIGIAVFWLFAIIFLQSKTFHAEENHLIACLDWNFYEKKILPFDRIISSNNYFALFFSLTKSRCRLRK